jgi:hypothetical protein
MKRELRIYGTDAEIDPEDEEFIAKAGLLVRPKGWRQRLGAALGRGSLWERIGTK